jgi:F-type H+-transporting ATPase subunit c
MDSDIAIRLGYPLALAAAAIGSAMGLGKAVSAAMEAMGRQPEAAGRIQTAMIIGCAFIEALTIYALISVFLIPAPSAPQQPAATPAQEEARAAVTSSVEVAYEAPGIDVNRFRMM